MGQKLRIEGIYDKRTLTHLKDQGLKDFCFDFSLKSFNFVQEYVFIEQLLNTLDSSDRIFLHFSSSSDPMVNKLITDLSMAGHSLNNVYFEFDEWAKDFSPQSFGFNYLLGFNKDSDPTKFIGNNFKGFIFEYNFFEELFRKNTLNNFAANFYTRYNNKIDEKSIMLLRVDWSNNLLASLFELFDFNLLSFPINSKIEVCYRNVDLNKLSNEMRILRKNAFFFQDL